ncbi:MAG TPA: hypothetical protein VL974_15250 [Magnetospirillum sp.]|jgi:hypothetical protein|nr:hypothetical protein [Magnetospirillum sp.]
MRRIGIEHVKGRHLKFLWLALSLGVAGCISSSNPSPPPPSSTTVVVPPGSTVCSNGHAPPCP